MAVPSTHPGLCATCLHARRVRGANTTFWLCGRSRTDRRFPRYPRLPVERCAGYERGAAERRPLTSR